MFRKAPFILIIAASLFLVPFGAGATTTATTATTTTATSSGYYYWDDGSYYGQLQNGIPNGYGKSTYMNGETYKGHWANGLMNGHGTYNWPDGKLYVGEWKNGHMNGQGLMIYSDGSTYSGEFYQDRPTGSGESATGGIRVVYNSQAIKFDVNPFTAYKRVMVPVRGVFEAAGAQIGWDEVKQTVLIEKGSTSIVLVVDNVAAQVNGQSSELEVAPVAYKNRVFVPLRFVAENLGAAVAWDSSNQVVWIADDSQADNSSNDTSDSHNVSIPDQSINNTSHHNYSDYNSNDYNSNDYNNGYYNHDYSSSGHIGPQLTGWESDGHLVLSWDQVDASDFNGYKVVISATDSSPQYPDNGYLFYITDRGKTSVAVDNTSSYNGGDFGAYLEPGQTYYFSITALYANEKVPGNVITLTYPYY